jgi:hypothetical protein
MPPSRLPCGGLHEGRSAAETLGAHPDPRRRVLRWIRIGVLILTGLVTLQSVLLVAGAWRNGLAIQRNMGVAEAEVLNTGRRRSTIEFVTPDRVIYRPELGGLALAEKHDVSPKNGSL